MKRLLVFFVLLAGGALVFAQDYRTLDAAIKAASDAFLTNSSLEDEDVLGGLSVESGNAALSEYIIEHLTANLINDQKFVVVSRERQTQILRGTEFEGQTYGSVSEDVKMAIGKMLDLTIIMSGNIVPADNVYRMTINATALSGRDLFKFIATIEKDKTIVRLTRDDAWKNRSVYIGVRGGGTMPLFNLSQTEEPSYKAGKIESLQIITPNAAFEIAFQSKKHISLQFEFLFTQSKMNWKSGKDWQSIETTNILAPILIKPTFYAKNLYFSPFVGGYPKFSWGNYQFSQTTQSNSESKGRGDIIFDVMGGIVFGGDIGFHVWHDIALFLDVRYLIDLGRTRPMRDKIDPREGNSSMIYGMGPGDTLYMQQMFMASVGLRWGLGSKK